MYVVHIYRVNIFFFNKSIFFFLEYKTNNNNNVYTRLLCMIHLYTCTRVLVLVLCILMCVQVHHGNVYDVCCQKKHYHLFITCIFFFPTLLSLLATFNLDRTVLHNACACMDILLSLVPAVDVVFF